MNSFSCSSTKAFAYKAACRPIATGWLDDRQILFSISSTTSAAPSWDITAGDSAASGEEDWQRASCYLAEGKKARAIDWVRSECSKDPANERFRDQLIELYFEQEEYAKAVEVLWPKRVGALTDEQAVVEIAESFSRLGNLPKAVAVLESGTTLNPKSAVLQLALADYCRKSGNLEKAAAAERKGKKLMTAGPAS